MPESSRHGPGRDLPASLPEARPTVAQRRGLARGLDQPGGKLPLFDADGQRIAERTIRSCIAHGWAEPWFDNPLKRDWLVCRLTKLGRAVAGEADDTATS